jgi:glutathione synthase/RimK-type ligase-like ATP-grasp enzyme
MFDVNNILAIAQKYISDDDLVAKHKSDLSHSIAVFYSFKKHKTGYTERLFNTLNNHALERGMSLIKTSLKDLIFIINDNKLSVIDSVNAINMADMGAIYCELWNKCPDQALSLATFAANHHIPVLNNELKHLAIDSKISQLAILADNDINIVNSIMTSNSNLKHIFKSKDSAKYYPFILKSANGWGGNHNYFIKNYEMLSDILDSNKDLFFVAQEFIPNTHDYRLLVIDGQIKLILKRTRNSANETHLNNTSKGGEGELVDINGFSQEAIKASIKASKLLKRDGFAGVDLLFNQYTGEYSILEVNRTPQIEIGSHPEDKIAIILDRMQDLIANNTDKIGN